MLSFYPRTMKAFESTPLTLTEATMRELQAYQPLFEKVFAVMKTRDLSALPPGKYTVDGDDVFFNIGEAGPRAAKDAKLESHRKYIDLQILLSGTPETHGVAEVSDCKNITEPYRSDHDIAFYGDAWTRSVTVKPGEFVVYTPATAHAPNITDGDIKKCVFKVRAL